MASFGRGAPGRGHAKEDSGRRILCQCDQTVLDRLFDLRPGTHDLGGGVTAVVTTGDGRLDVWKYRDARLLSVFGVVATSGRVEAELIRYDAQGRTVLEIRTRADGMGQSPGMATSAGLQRDIRWYAAGRLVRELYDTLGVRVEPGERVEAGGLSGVEAASAQYSAVVQEHEGDALATLGSLDVSSDGTLAAFVIGYDAHGCQIEERDFSDAPASGARGALERVRRVKVSRAPRDWPGESAWGQVVSDAGAEERGRATPDAASLLGLDAAEILQADALTAGDLLALVFARACERPEVFAAGALAHMARESLAGLERQDVGPCEAALDARWVVRTLAGGQVVSRREDSLRVSPVRECERPAGQSSGEGRAVARSCDHLEELYEDGRLVRHARSSLWEEARPDGSGGTTPATRAKAVLVGGEGPAEGEAEFPGGLLDVDDEALAALAGLTRAAGRTLARVGELFGRLGG